MRRLLIGAIAVVFAASLLSGVTEVRPGERAVVRRFGRVLDYKPEPGLWIGWPWGIDRVDRVPVDLVRRVLVGYQEDDAGTQQPPPGQLLTGDHNLVNIQVVLFYSIIEDQVEEYIVQADRTDSLVARAAEAAMTEWVASRSVDHVLLHGKGQLPGWLAERTQRSIEPYRLGIKIRTEASVTYLHPPRQVQQAFQEVTQAQTEIRTKINEAEEEANRRQRDAEAEKFRIEQLAAADCFKQRLLAEADAGSFVQRHRQYQRLRDKNPAYLAGIWWDELGKLFTNMQKSGHLDLLDNHLGAEGLDITVFPPLPKKK